MNLNNNLVWIDLEMTGLEVKKDVILEIACIITDGNLNNIVEGPSLVIHQSEDVLVSMEAWPKQHHTQSGLLERVRASSIFTEQAEEQIMMFIRQYCSPGTGLLAGNSVWQDRIFLQAYMPRILKHLHYRIIDVTSVKELVAHWYPNDPHVKFEKKDAHRALQDIQESIAELKHFRTYFFV
ncbi:MAG TPA: oligoribonuclease [Candidatus Babeliales bacterium]|nr:oligoribonuclease [Candidatus Babeliales bacterium]